MTNRRIELDPDAVQRMREALDRFGAAYAARLRETERALGAVGRDYASQLAGVLREHNARQR